MWTRTDIPYMARIGIFGVHEDPQVQLLKKRLAAEKIDAHIISFRGFPKTKTLTMTARKIMFGGVNLMDLDVFFIRQLGYLWPIPQQELTKREWAARYGRYMDYVTDERENISLKHSMIRMLGMEKFVVNPYESFIYHRLKAYELYMFKKNDLPVPDFIAGNDASAVKGKSAKMIYKALAGGIHTQLADADFFEETEELWARRAGLFQRYIKGTNIRAYAVGDEIIGAGELISGPQVDSRIEQKGVRVVELPGDIEQLALKAKNLLGMYFSGIDFMYSKGRYHLLECNPSPMFYGFEHMTKIPVSKRLARFLVEHLKK